jgi:hypothetical protein
LDVPMMGTPYKTIFMAPAQQYILRQHRVRFGSKGHIRCKHNVRFTPESGHVHCTSSCLLWAKSGHRACNAHHNNKAAN